MDGNSPFEIERSCSNAAFRKGNRNVILAVRLLLALKSKLYYQTM